MSVDTNLVPTKLLWVDLEMTGLSPKEDVLLEVAAEITDFDFKTLESYEARIAQDHDTVVARMQQNIWWREYPENRDEFLNKLGEGKGLAVVEQELITLVEKHFGDEPAVLAGNSIYNDRLFIKQWMPALDLKLHYRMLDVSSFKILMQGKYQQVFEKDSKHRAFDDIQASIAELQHYIDWFRQTDQT
jgi:oligoribonuclease